MKTRRRSSSWEGRHLHLNRWGFQAPRWASNLQLLHKQDLYCSIIGRLHRHCGAFRCWHQSPSEHQAPSSSSGRVSTLFSSSSLPPLLSTFCEIFRQRRGLSCDRKKGSRRAGPLSVVMAGLDGNEEPESSSVPLTRRFQVYKNDYKN